MKFFLAIFLGILTIQAKADCSYSLTIPQLSYTVGTTNSSVPGSFTFSRENKGGAGCNDYVIGFSRGGSATYNRIAKNLLNGVTIPYNIYKLASATTPLRRLDNATSTAQVITGTIAKKETKSLTYFFKLGALSTTTMTRAGTYSDTIQVEASPGTFSDVENPEIIQPLQVSIIVPNSIAISLVDTGNPHNESSTSKILDFGELTESEELGFDVRIVSNAGYTLSVSSSNNQNLQIDELPGNPNAKIAYDFFVSNVFRNLTSSASSPVTIGTGSGSTPIQGVSLPVRIVIKSVDNKISGTYKDYVTFTVATTE